MPIKIIPFQLSYSNELIKMLKEVSSFYPTHYNLDSIYMEFISQNNLYSIVSLLGKEDVGFGSIFFLQIIRGGKEEIIENLNVSRNLIKLGIGLKILNKLISESKVKKCFKICLESFYPLKGFYSKEVFLKGILIMKNFI